MVRRRGNRVTDDQVRRMVELDRQGESISAIARAVGCHRQTVKSYLVGRRGDILADEVRKQLLTDELRRHLDDLAQFADSLVSYLRVPTSPKDAGDAEEVLTPLWGKDRQATHHSKLLFASLHQHTGEGGWWVAFKEWQESWNTCKRAREEIRGEAYEMVRNLINQKAGLKEEIERQSSEGRDVIGRIADDVLWVVWWAGTGDRPVEEIKFQIKGNQIEVETGTRTFYAFMERVSKVSLGPDMLEVCELSFEPLYQSFISKGISEMLDTMRGKIDKVGDSLDPSILRPQILRTRCELCPA